MSQFLDEFFGESDDEYYYDKGNSPVIEKELADKFIVTSSDSQRYELDISQLQTNINQPKKNKKKKNKKISNKQPQKKKIEYIEKPEHLKKSVKNYLSKSKKHRKIPRDKDEVDFQTPVFQIEKLHLRILEPPKYSKNESKREKYNIQRFRSCVYFHPPDLVILHGGINSENQITDDFLVHNIKQDTWKNHLRHFDKYRKTKSSIRHSHKGFYITRELFGVFNGRREMFVCFHPNYTERNQKVTKFKWAKYPISNFIKSSNSGFQNLTGFTLEKFEQFVIVFGGRISGTKCSNLSHAITPFQFINNDNNRIIKIRRPGRNERTPEGRKRFFHIDWKISWTTISGFLTLPMICRGENLPLGRFDHSSCSTRTRFFIFGGISESGNILNDLWSADFQKTKGVIIWKRIFCESFSPPGLILPIFLVSHIRGDFFLYGGFSEKDRSSIPEEKMYKFYRSEKYEDEGKWVASQPLRTTNVIPIGECCYSSKNLNCSYFGGGRTREIGRNKNSVNSKIIELSGVSVKESKFEIFEFLELQRKRKNYTDFIILVHYKKKNIQKMKKQKKKNDLFDDVFSDDEEIEGEREIEIDEEELERIRTYEVHCHKCILSARSEILRNILLDKDINKIDVFDKNPKVVECYIKFLYTCKIKISGDKNIKELLDCAKEWGYFDEISKIVCFSEESRNLKFSHELIRTMKTQFFGLFLMTVVPKDLLVNDKTEEIIEIPSLGVYEEEEEEDNNEENKNKLNSEIGEDIIEELLEDKIISFGNCYFSDLRIFLTPPNSDEKYLFRCHKVFLTKSKFVSKCLTSGMMEEIESKLLFENLSLRGLGSVLEYLYVSEISDIDHSTAIEIHIFALLFKLDKISQICRSIILDLIDESSVIEVLLIFDMYQDDVISDRCIRYMVAHEDYDELFKNNNHLMENLSIKLKSKLSFLRIRKVEKEYKKIKRDLKKK